MSHFLALDIDGKEARVAVASSRGGSAVIEQAFAVALTPRQPGGDEAKVDVGERIAAALAARDIGRMDTLVAVGRTTIELRQLSLPPAPEEELPEIVRFQAMREFNELDEDWLLDFVPIDQPDDGPRSVLAAAIAPKPVEQIRQTCQTANLKLRRVLLRPCAAAALIARVPTAEPGRLSLLVDLLGDEAELTVMADRKVIFLRTARLPGDPLAAAEHRPALTAEIRRTMVAAQNQLGGRRVEAIMLCGPSEQHSALATAIAESLHTPTEVFDPFSGLQLGSQLRRKLPERPGQFAPLLGALLAEFEETPHAIDFLHPRRPPQPPSQRRKYVFAGVAVAVLLLLFLGYRALEMSSLKKQNADLVKKSTALDGVIERGKKVQAEVKAIEAWLATDVVWLDELHWLSTTFPPAEDGILTHLQCGPEVGGGEMLLEGGAKSIESVATMKGQLVDERHKWIGKGIQADDSLRKYSLQFSASVPVEREEP